MRLVLLSLVLLAFWPRDLSDAYRTRVENFGPKIAHRYYEAPSLREFGAFTSPANDSPKEIALRFARTHLTDTNFVVKNAYRSDHNGVTHVYLRQVINGLEVINADININVDAHGRVISYGDSFYRGTIAGDDLEFDVQVLLAGRGAPNRRRSVNVPPVRPTTVVRINRHDARVISPMDALQSLGRFIGREIPHPEEIEVTESYSFDGEPALVISHVPWAISDVHATQAYIQLDDATLQLVWDLTVEMEENWYNAHVNAHDGRVVALVDWVSDATYNVFPLGVNDPSDGPREILVDPHDTVASPEGWHHQSTRRTYTDTRGNNVYAHENVNGGWDWEDNLRPDGGSKLQFDFPIYFDQRPKTYLNASVTNLFYWNNIMHDVFYRYGFNEVAGNFQENNFNKGGKDHDAVIANAQDGSGYDNANFATPPDGRHGKMRMYIWDVTDPMRDGDLESGIIIHEYSHGISTRLTGGPANSNCLGFGEAGGMGEGWGDFFATILRMNSSVTRYDDFGMGDWANGGDNIRRYKYSTSKTTNPETYAYMNKAAYWGVHAKGAVWAEMLFEIYWNFVDKYGFTQDWYPPTNPDDESSWYVVPKDHTKSKYPKHGNTLFLQLVVDGMKLQPCMPNFLAARDAILQADEVLTGGANECLIWKGFTKRGLGKNAYISGESPWGGGVRYEDFVEPENCQNE